MLVLQIALGAGLVAVTVWGVQRVVVPYATSWYRSWTGKPDPAEQNQAQIATVSFCCITASELRLDAVHVFVRDCQRKRK